MWTKVAFLLILYSVVSCGGGSTSDGEGSDDKGYDGSWRGIATSTDGNAGGTIDLRITQFVVTRQCESPFGGNYVECPRTIMQGLVLFPPCVPITPFEGATRQNSFSIHTEFGRYAASLWLEVVSVSPDPPTVIPVGTEMTGQYRFTSDIAGCPAVDNGTVTLVKVSDVN